MDCTSLSTIHKGGNYIGCIMQGLDTTTTTALELALQNFIANYLPTVAVLVTLSLMLIGWSVVIGKNDNISLKQIAAALLMTGFIYAAIDNFMEIFHVVHPLITQAPAELASYLVPHTIATGPDTDEATALTTAVQKSTYKSLDDMAKIIMGNCWQMIEQPDTSFIKGSYKFGTLLAGILFAVCSLIYLAVAAGFLIMNHVRASFLLLFSPLFISFLLFQKTRGMTQQWIQNLIATALTALFIYAVIALNNNIAKTMILSLTTEKNRRHRKFGRHAHHDRRDGVDLRDPHPGPRHRRRDRRLGRLTRTRRACRRSGRGRGRCRRDRCGCAAHRHHIVQRHQTGAHRQH